MGIKNLEEWLEYQQQVHLKTIDLGLDRINQVYKKLFPNGVDFKVITIAGTNGKGSTGAFISNIFNLAKVNYGWFSSPHIDKYNERFDINGKNASDSEIISVFIQIEKLRDNVSLSYFEFSTLASLIIFTQRKVQIAILEIGLGGRLDSVNVVPNDIAIITSIALDHCNYLGDTLDEIAVEKAGIINVGKTCLIANNLPKIIDKIAIQKQANLIKVNLYDGELSMLGNWQKSNAAIAKNAVELLTTIDEKTIIDGLKNTTIAARNQTIKYKNKAITFDVAHNFEACKNLATTINKPTTAIFGALKDKDIKFMISAITHKIDMWILVSTTGERGFCARDLQKYFDAENTTTCTCIASAIKQGLKYKNNILVFGSFLVVSSAIKYCKINIHE